MSIHDFYINHFSNLCCYEDFLMRIDLMGRKHNDKEVLDSLPKCNGHGYIVAAGEVIWINDNGEKVDNPNITCVPEYAFSYCTEIQRIVIPDSVTRIGGGAFKGCGELTYVKIPCGVTSIDRSAFYGCYELTSVTIPYSVTSIGDYAFDLCFNLKSAKVPKNCNIGRDVFPPDCAVQYYY